MSLLGALFALSAPGYGLWWLAWIVLVPALQWARKQTATHAFGGGFCMGMAYHALYFIWFWDLHPLTWLGFSNAGSLLATGMGWCLLALEGGLLLGILLALYQRLSQSRTGWACVLAFPFLWVAGFSLFNLTPITLPWSLVEYSQSALPTMRYLAGLVGGSGLAYLVVLHNSIWAEFLPKKKPVLQIFTLLVPLLLGLFSNQPVKTLNLPASIAVVQGNLPIELVRSALLDERTIRPSYMTPLEQSPLPSGTLVALPEEGVVPGWVHISTPLQNPMMKTLSALAQAKQLNITVGVSSQDADGHHYNSIALISAAGHPSQVTFYHKRRLVPFGETTPFGLELALEKLLAAFQVSYGNIYQTGPATVAPLTTGRLKLGPLVCFEIIDTNPFNGGFAGSYRKQGANLLLNASNLGWFHENPFLEAQFLSIAQMRAAENRLPMVIASNTGTSAILDAHGNILKRTVPQHKPQLIFYNSTEDFPQIR